MKTPKNEPYRRSRHRAALHAWVVAATAVAAIGMPVNAATLKRDQDQVRAEQGEEAPRRVRRSAQAVATQWWDALRSAYPASALSMMRLPGDAQAERDAVDEALALGDYLGESRVAVEPVAHRRAGHWALSAWRLGDDPQLEPVTLYHPAPDGLLDGVFGEAGGWQVVPQGFETDPALAPLVNTDHATLIDWYRTLA